MNTDDHFIACHLTQDPREYSVVFEDGHDAVGMRYLPRQRLSLYSASV